jgi:hypothetical protein
VYAIAVSSGLTCKIPASLVSGIEIAELPVASSPRYATVRPLFAARRAFWEICAGSERPASGVEASSATSFTR